MEWTLWLIGAAVVAGFFLLKRVSFISANTAREMLKAGALVVDVRTANEFRSGHLSGAINVELGDLRDEIGRRVPDKNRVLLLHCLSGGRSGMARQQLKRLGYPNVHNLGSYSRAESIVRSAGAQFP